MSEQRHSDKIKRGSNAARGLRSKQFPRSLTYSSKIQSAMSRCSPSEDRTNEEKYVDCWYSIRFGAFFETSEVVDFDSMSGWQGLAFIKRGRAKLNRMSNGIWSMKGSIQQRRRVRRLMVFMCRVVCDDCF